MVSSLSAAPAISISVGSSVRPGLVGTIVLQEEDLSLQLPPPLQIPRRWWLALRPSRDLRQSRQLLQVLQDDSLAGEFARQEPAVAVVAVGGRQSNRYPV